VGRRIGKEKKAREERHGKDKINAAIS